MARQKDTLNNKDPRAWVERQVLAVEQLVSNEPGETRGRKLDAILKKARKRDLLEPVLMKALFFAYRTCGEWERMTSLYEHMPREMQREDKLVEQCAFAYNRQAWPEADDEDDPAPETRPDLAMKALKMLRALQERRGGRADPETSGLMGRIYKDLWLRQGNRRHLEESFKAYASGFEVCLPPLFYPGINLATLCEAMDDQETKARILPVVRLSAEHQWNVNPDFWSRATLLEVAVLEDNHQEAEQRLAEIIGQSHAANEQWQLKTVAKNLGIILLARKEAEQRPGASNIPRDLAWLASIIERVVQAHDNFDERYQPRIYQMLSFRSSRGKPKKTKALTAAQYRRQVKRGDRWDIFLDCTTALSRAQTAELHLNGELLPGLPRMEALALESLLEKPNDQINPHTALTRKLAAISPNQKGDPPSQGACEKYFQRVTRKVTVGLGLDKKAGKNLFTTDRDSGAITLYQFNPPTDLTFAFICWLPDPLDMDA